jgi:putative membrane protein
MRYILLALSAAALAACGQQMASTESTTATDTMTAQAPMPAQTPAQPAMTDAQFVQNVVNATAFEVQSSQLAPRHAHAQAVKEFAARMVRDHTQAAAQLTALLPSLSITAPSPTLDTAQQTTLDALRTANGAAFDTAYASAQLQAHQQAVSLFENYSSTAAAGPLKDFANNTLPTLREHLSMAQGLQTPS